MEYQLTYCNYSLMMYTSLDLILRKIPIVIYSFAFIIIVS